MIRLSRLPLIGQVDQNTPIIVLDLIAHSHGIKFNSEKLDNLIYRTNLIYTINNCDGTIIPDLEVASQSDKYLSIIVRFVNHEALWNKNKIIVAFKHLYKYINDISLLDKIDINKSIFGKIIPLRVHSLDCSILYALCKRYRLITNPGTTLDDMVNMLKLYKLTQTDNGKHDISEYIKNYLSNTMPSNLINIISTLNILDQTRSTLIPQNNILIARPNVPEIPFLVSNKVDNNYDPNDLSPNNLLKAYRKISLIQTTNSPVIVDSNVAAIIVMIMRHKLDLTKFNDPLHVYNYYKINRCFPDPSVNNNLKHPELSINLNIVFNPILPIELYNTSQLLTLVELYGYNPSEIKDDDCYSLLQTTVLLNNFTTIKPDAKILNEYDNLSSNTIEECQEIIYYGNCESGYYWIEVDSLIDAWQRYRGFRNFCVVGVHSYSQREILRLKNILKYYIDDSCYKLAEIIDEIIIICTLHNDITNRMIGHYNNNVKDNETWLTIFKHVYYIGLYLRGYKNLDKYYVPKDCQDVEMYYITGKCSSEDVDITDEISASSNAEFKLLMKILNANPTIKELFQSLLIYKYIDNQLQIENDKSQGTTLGRRLEIIFDEPHNLYGCVRMSSNILLHSYYYYMKALNQHVNFKPEDVNRIG